MEDWLNTQETDDWDVAYVVGAACPTTIGTATTDDQKRPAEAEDTDDFFYDVGAACPTTVGTPTVDDQKRPAQAELVKPQPSAGQAPWFDDFECEPQEVHAANHVANAIDEGPVFVEATDSSQGEALPVPSRSAQVEQEWLKRLHAQEIDWVKKCRTDRNPDPKGRGWISRFAAEPNCIFICEKDDGHRSDVKSYAWFDVHV